MLYIHSFEPVEMFFLVTEPEDRAGGEPSIQPNTIMARNFPLFIQICLKLSADLPI